MPLIFLLGILLGLLIGFFIGNIYTYKEIMDSAFISKMNNESLKIRSGNKIAKLEVKEIGVEE